MRWVLYANIFIALCAMAYMAEGYLISGREMQFDALFYLSGTSTLFIYLLIRVVAARRIEVYDKDERWSFFLKNLPAFRISTLCSLLASAVLYFFLDRSVQIALLVPGIISVIYGLPLGKKFRLRDVGVIKIFLISFVWAFISAVLPAINSDDKFFDTRVLLLFAANYLFIFAITLPFDIKDMKVDALHHVKTIPVYIGEENTYSLSMMLLFISSALHVYVQRMLPVGDTDYTIPLTISILLTGLTIWLSKGRETINMIYFGLLDGMILIQFVLCYVFKQMN